MATFRLASILLPPLYLLRSAPLRHSTRCCLPLGFCLIISDSIVFPRSPKSCYNFQQKAALNKQQLDEGPSRSRLCWDPLARVGSTWASSTGTVIRLGLATTLGCTWPVPLSTLLRTVPFLPSLPSRSHSRSFPLSALTQFFLRSSLSIFPPLSVILILLFFFFFSPLRLNRNPLALFDLF